jgi:DHA2 family multidrug resistance protein
MATSQDIANRLPITVSLIVATIMTSLDSTIANVALPHMQGSFSASQEQTAWVLTSYIVATAIMTPLTGWLAVRIGVKHVFLFSIAGFTIASMLCGSATSLVEIVGFRVLQGLCGAALVPLCQLVMLDLYPPQQVGQVMALWGAATLLGPILGPVLGGWLTDNFSWRWVFYINLPVGVLAFIGGWIFMSEGAGSRARPFDFLGYGALCTFIVGLQLVLDRGPTQDWFASREIWAEAIVAAIGLYLFVIQTMTARQPFLDRSLPVDRNFVLGNSFSALLNLLLFSTMALQPPLMQTLMGYSVFGAGLTMMPRGLGSFTSMLIAGRLVGRVEVRVLMMGGLFLCSVALLQMSHFDLAMSNGYFVTSGVIQGLGMGLMFVPLTVLTFATVDQRVRPDATAFLSFTRNIGQSVGISLMETIYTHQAAVSHGDMAAAVQPASPVFAASVPHALSPATTTGLTRLNGEITRQAAMVGYVDVFRLMCLCSLVMIPFVLALRPPKTTRQLNEVALD